MHSISQQAWPGKRRYVSVLPHEGPGIGTDDNKQILIKDGCLFVKLEGRKTSPSVPSGNDLVNDKNTYGKSRAKVYDQIINRRSDYLRFAGVKVVRSDLKDRNIGRQAR